MVVGDGYRVGSDGVLDQYAREPRLLAVPMHEALANLLCLTLCAFVEGINELCGTSILSWLHFRLGPALCGIRRAREHLHIGYDRA